MRHLPAVCKQQSEIKMRHLPAVYRVKSTSTIRYPLLSYMEICRQQARLKCATYRRQTDLSVRGVRVGVDYQIPVTQLYGDMQAANID